MKSINLKMVEALRERERERERESYNLKDGKGITLIALVVTIIVLLVLSGVVINMLIGSEGIITKAQNAKITTELGQLQEQVDIAISNERLNKKEDFNINDYRTLKDFNPEIESKYSEYIGINNGKIYIKSYAAESIKNAVENSGIEVGRAAIQDENGEIKIADATNIKNYRIYGNTEENSVGAFDETKNQYKIPIIVRGKNLLDISKLYTHNYSASGSLIINENSFNFKRISTQCTSAVALKLFLKEGDYVISGSCSQDDGLNGGWGIFDNENQTYIENKSGIGYVKGKFTITESKEYRVAFFCDYSSIDGTRVEYNNIQLEKGIAYTAYEPYIEPQTYNIYLNAPLRSNGEVADYIDFEKQKVIRMISDTGEILDTPIEEDVDLSEIKINAGSTNIITVDTDVSPSKVEIEY